MGFFDLDTPHYNFENFNLDDIIKNTIYFLKDKKPDGTHERFICAEVRWQNDIKALMRHLGEDNFETAKEIYINRYRLIESEQKKEKLKSNILQWIGVVLFWSIIFLLIN